MDRHIGFSTGFASGIGARDVVVRDETDRETVEVIGLSVDEVSSALGLLAKVRQLSGEVNGLMTSQLLLALVSMRQPVTTETDLAVGQGVASLRAQLLESPYETYESLSLRRGATPSTTRAWVKRTRDTGALFTVTHGGRTLLPSFQFDATGGVNPTSAAVVRELMDAGLLGWQLWEWLVSPTGWLDGDVPADLIDTEPDTVVAAATEYAVELRRGREGALSSGQISVPVVSAAP